MKKLLKRIFRKRKGVTILEGLISLGLLALVASGTFGVLLSISRQASSPDIREEMVWAVERANEQLQMYAAAFSGVGSTQVNIPQASGLCGNDSNPLESGKQHYINCMLPAICDPSTSEFYYVPVNETVPLFPPSYDSEGPGRVEDYTTDTAPTKEIEYTITCNGFTL